MRDRATHSLFKVLFVRSFMAEAGVLIALMTFVLVLMSMLASQNEQSRIEHETVKLEQGVARTESEVGSLYYAQRTALVENTLTRLIYLYGDLDWYTRYELQTRLQKDMYRLVDAYRYAKAAYIYLPTLDKLISNARIVQDIPEWLQHQLDESRDGTHYEQGRLFNMQVRTDAEGQSVEAMCLVELDAAHLLRDLSYIPSDYADCFQLRWRQSGELIGTADDQGMQLLSSVPDESDGFIISADSEVLDCRVSYRLSPKQDDEVLRRFRLLLSGFMGLVLVYEALWFFLWYRKIYRPLHVLLVDAFGKAEAGDFKSRIPISPHSPFSAIYVSYNHMMAQMESYVENNLKQQILIGKANLKQLQAQINPHFMYNSYYVLYRLIKKGDLDSSVRLAEHLGQFYQYITRNAEDEKRLSEEVEHAQVYAHIQQFRFRDRLDYQIESPPAEIAGVYVPRLVLQPILENAFKYAYELDVSEAPIVLKLSYQVTDRYHFDVIVENSGDLTKDTLCRLHQRLAEDDGSGEATALVNIHRRLRIYYGGDSSLMVERSSLGGLLVRMRIIDDREE